MRWGINHFCVFTRKIISMGFWNKSKMSHRLIMDENVLQCLLRSSSVVLFQPWLAVKADSFSTVIIWLFFLACLGTALIRGWRLLKELIEWRRNYFENSNIFFLILVHLHTNQQIVKFTLSHSVYIIVGLIITVYYLHAWHGCLLYIGIVKVK